MKPLIINGSPRNKKSNSKILIEKFIEGYTNSVVMEPPVCYLADPGQKEMAIDLFRTSDTVIFVFPLYTDCMPGIVKEYIENIGDEEFDSKKKIGFIVQSGFPESIHSEALESYLKKLTIKRLKAEYLGTVIKGGVEGIQIMPERMTRNLFKSFYMLGEYFGRYGSFSEEIKDKLGKPYKMSSLRLGMFRILKLTGLTNFYWNSRLKQNNAFEKRYARPYQSSLN